MLGGGPPQNLKVVVGDFQLTKRSRAVQTGDNAVHPTAIQHTEVILKFRGSGVLAQNLIEQPGHHSGRIGHRRGPVPLNRSSMVSRNLIGMDHRLGADVAGAPGKPRNAAKLPKGRPAPSPRRVRKPTKVTARRERQTGQSASCWRWAARLPTGTPQ